MDIRARTRLHRAVPAVAIVAACAALAPTPAHAAGALTLRVDQVDVREFPQVRLYVTAVDVDGAPVLELGDGAFRVTEDGAPAAQPEVKKFFDSGVGVAVTLAIDVSGTMRGAPIRNAKLAARAFADKLGANDRLAVVTFGDSVELAAGFGLERATTLEQIDAIEATGKKTMLHDGLFEAIRRLGAPGLPLRKAVVVISDGKDTGSGVTLEDCVAAATEQRVQISAIGLSRIGEEPLKNLRRLASLTDGTYLRAKKAEDLAGLYVALAERLQNTYVITFTAKEITADGADHSVLVAATAGDQKAEATERFRVERALKPPAPDAGPAVVAAVEQGWLEQTLGEKWWIVLLAGGGALVLAVILIVALIPRKRLCDKCGSAVDRETGACATCAADAKEATVQAAQAPTPVVAALLVRDGPGKGRTHEIRETSALLGRDADSCHILLEDEAASRVHANVQLTPSGFVIADMKSSYGTKVNGNKITESVQLANNDVIKIGDTELMFQDRRAG